MCGLTFFTYFILIGIVVGLGTVLKVPLEKLIKDGVEKILVITSSSYSTGTC